MESEKVMYWMTLGVLALATATGFVTEHRGWSDRLVDRSVAVVSQASDVAAHYAEMADLMLGRGENELSGSGRNVFDVENPVQAEVQARLACAQVRRQAQLVRPQVSGCRCGLGSAPRAPSFCPPEHVTKFHRPEPPE
jgi:hypothetical protein